MTLKLFIQTLNLDHCDFAVDHKKVFGGQFHDPLQFFTFQLQLLNTGIDLAAELEWTEKSVNQIPELLTYVRTLHKRRDNTNLVCICLSGHIA